MSAASRGDLIRALVSFAATPMLKRRRWKGDDMRRKG
jgi:hypothetical protein